MASDEDVRTWWSAKSGDAGEWLQMDLGSVRGINAVQLNLFEQDCSAGVKFEDDRQRFVLAGSEDGANWKPLIDRSEAADCSPHTYLAFDEPVRVRFLKVTCISMPAGGKFAVSDLRVFGNGDGAAPAAVKELVAKLDAADRRKVELSWDAVDGAWSYLIRYGVGKSKLYQSHLVRANAGTKVSLYCLNVEPEYWFRVDALNEVGSCTGDAVTCH